jgi:hypothetical protein
MAPSAEPGDDPVQGHADAASGGRPAASAGFRHGARELASETPDWATSQRALDAIRDDMRLLSWSPYSFRRAGLGNGRSWELIVPCGATGYILTEIVNDDGVVGAVRHQREEDCRS